MVYSWLKNNLSLLLPQVCQLCGDITGGSNVGLCRACHDALPSMPLGCMRCANPLSSSNKSDKLLCGHCLKQPPAYDDTIALFPYQQPIDSLVQALKFRHQLNHGLLLAKLMARHLADKQASADCIIPVPLHSTRLRQRGFNQALELARPISKKLNIPIDSHSCRRRHDTQSQSSLPLDQRKQNVRYAFVVKPCRYEHVAIVDDVMTSGHTVNALATALKHQGVKKVSVWTCCRAYIR